MLRATRDYRLAKTFGWTLDEIDNADEQRCTDLLLADAEANRAQARALERIRTDAPAEPAGPVPLPPGMTPRQAAAFMGYDESLSDEALRAMFGVEEMAVLL